VAEAARITIRVHPGASRIKVASMPPEPGQGQLLEVWVTQRAVEGRATEAALAALADALGVRRRSVRLIAGARSRTKVVEVTDPPPDLASRLAGGSA